MAPVKCRLVNPQPTRTTWSRLLLAALVLRWILHALYLPVFEGPDEPFHLARIRAVADAWAGDETWPDALTGKAIDSELAAAMATYPCGADMQRAFECPAWSDDSSAFGQAEFNAFAPPPARADLPSAALENYQAHQPPLYYLGAGTILALAGVDGIADQLVFLRLVAVLLAATGVWLLLPTLPTPWKLVFLAGLWLPGATESLIRVANDVPVFLWAAALLRVGLGRRHAALTTLGLAGLVALGPLCKLTAFPLVALVVVHRWFDGHRRQAVVLAMAGALVVPLQWLRGWAWGGTLEVDAGVVPTDPWAAVVVGIAHSAYTFVKTAAWLGGWSVFKPPMWLLWSSAGLVIAWLWSCRIRRGPGSPRGTWLSHGAAATVATAGFVAFALGKRQLFGVWGAVGGWYAWAWWPWLCVAGRDLLEAREHGEAMRTLRIVTLVWLLVVNAAWWWAAHGTYG